MDVIRIVAQGPTDQPLRRYHLNVRFPNEHFNFLPEDRDNWHQQVRALSLHGYERLAMILGPVLARGDVTAASLRQHNFAVSIDLKAPAACRRRWNEIDALIVQSAGQSGRTAGAGAWNVGSREIPPLPVEFSEFDAPTAVGPSPQKRVALDLPRGFNAECFEIRRGIDHWGQIDLRVAKRLRAELCQILIELSRIQALSCIRVTSRLIECSFGLAYARFPIEPQIREIVERNVAAALAATG